MIQKFYQGFDVFFFFTLSSNGRTKNQLWSRITSQPDIKLASRRSPVGSPRRFTVRASIRPWTSPNLAPTVRPFIFPCPYGACLRPTELNLSPGSYWPASLTIVFKGEREGASGGRITTTTTPLGDLSLLFPGKPGVCSLLSCSALLSRWPDDSSFVFTKGPSSSHSERSQPGLEFLTQRQIDIFFLLNGKMYVGRRGKERGEARATSSFKPDQKKRGRKEKSQHGDE